MKTTLTSRRGCLALAGGLAIIAAAASLTAETLVLRDGTKVEGKLRSCDDTVCLIGTKKIPIETIARIELQPATSATALANGPSIVMADGTVRPGHFEGLSLGSVVIDGKEIDRENIVVIVLADIAASKQARDVLLLVDGSTRLGVLTTCNAASCRFDSRRIPLRSLRWIGLQQEGAVPPQAGDMDEVLFFKNKPAVTGRMSAIHSSTVRSTHGSFPRGDVTWIHIGQANPDPPESEITTTELPPPATPAPSPSPPGQRLQPPPSGMASLSQYNRGVEAVTAGRWAGAAQAFAEAVRLDPADADAHFQLGTAYKELGRFAEAAGEFTKTTVLKPRDGEAFFYLGWSENQLGQHGEALKPLRQAVVLMPNDARTRAELGYAYLKLGNQTEATRAYSEVVRLAPESARAHYLRGWSANAMGKFADAIEPLKRAISLQPDAADEHSELGFAYRNLKRYDDALGEYKRAIGLDPKYAPAHHGLGVTYWRLGNKAAAQEQYRILQGLDRDWAKKLGQVIGE